MKDETIKALAAMGCITVLTSVALAIGINGALFALVLIPLAGLGGYAIAKRSDTGY